MATGRIYFKKEYNLFFYLFLLFTVISFFCYKNNFSQDPGNRIISTWFWAQPKPTGTLLYSVHFINQMTGYAAGELGTIIKTTDGGSNWIQLTSNTSNDLSEIFFINNNLGFAVGRSGIVIRTKDGGTRWTQFKTGLNDYLHDVTFINKFTGYIAGLNGTILKTSNSGDSWKKLKTLSGAPLFCLSFLNENEGAAGGYNTILKTSDGGMNWSSQNINFNPSCAIVGISYIDNNTIYAAGNSSAGSFYKSADNGANWISSSLNLPYLFDGSVDLLRSMSFININTGFIVTDFGTILKTTNAGMSWQKDSSFRPSYEKLSVMYDINFRDPGFINISGSGGTIIRSTNSGLNWTAKTGNKKTLKSSCFINSKTGFAVGEKGIILKTEDEGMNWLELNSFTDKFLNSVFFINENTGYTAGYSGAIFKTTDCGVSWINQTNYAGYDINCIQFISDNEGIVAGGKPESERAFIYKTDDGGASWYEVYDSLSLGVLNSVDFMNGAYAIATGNNGNILKTFDKGESWSSWNISSENLLAIDFLNTQNALITGTNGLVYKTTNSGINWQVIVSGSYLNLSSVKYHEQDFAVAAGDNGKILTSTDSGFNWTAEQKITNNNLYCVSILDGKKIFASGEYGTIIYSDLNKSVLAEVEGKIQNRKYFMLSQNYPNPFNPVTLITYNIPAHSDRFSNVKLIVYNIQGKETETIVDTEQEAGVYKVKFDASDISSGIYFYSLYINGKITETKRMVVLK